MVGILNLEIADICIDSFNNYQNIKIKKCLEDKLGRAIFNRIIKEN